MSSAHGCPGQRPHSSALRFSTADYAARDRLQAWRELYGRTLLNLEIEPLDTREIHTDVLMRRVPGLGLIVGSRSGSIYRRERIDNDDVVMTIGVSNGFQATQFGRIASMDRSEAVVVTGAAPGHVRMPGGGRFITLCVPRHAISPSVTGLDAAFCRPITADNTALKLLTRYIGVLEEAETFAAPDLQRHTVTHVHDLIALAIGATRDAAEVATLRGARAARLRAIKEDIANNLGTDLSIAAMATRHRLPVRYVQRLFEAEDVTFTEFVLGHRLACAYRLLTDPRLVRRPVATIAFEAGFRDLSHFNRAFRRRVRRHSLGRAHRGTADGRLTHRGRTDRSDSARSETPQKSPCVEGLSRQEPGAGQGDDARRRRVRPPLPHPCAARRLPPSPKNPGKHRRMRSNLPAWRNPCSPGDRSPRSPHLEYCYCYSHGCWPHLCAWAP